MSLKQFAFIGFFIAILVSMRMPKTAFADLGQCNSIATPIEGVNKTIQEGTKNYNIKVSLDQNKLDLTHAYRFRFYESSVTVVCLPGFDCRDHGTSNSAIPQGNILDILLDDNATALKNTFPATDVSPKNIILQEETSGGNFEDICIVGKLSITQTRAKCEYTYIYQERTNSTTGDTKECYWNSSGSSCLDASLPIKTKTKFFLPATNEPYTARTRISIDGILGGLKEFEGYPNNEGILESVHPGDSADDHTLSFKYADLNPLGKDPDCPNIQFTTSARCNIDLSDCSSEPKAAQIINPTPFKLCDQITDTTLKGKCISCAGGDDQDAAGVWTAVGCIKREPTALISSLIQIGLSVAGGVTLLVILSAGFMLTTSQGDPKKAGEAKEMITAAVIGILFIIFSVTILQFIGYNILKIPGFGG